MDSSKRKALLFLIAGIVVLGLFLAVKLYTSRQVQKKESHTESVIDPELDYSTDTIKSKSGAYERGESDSARQASKKKVSFDELSNMTKNKDDLGFKQNNTTDNSEDSKPVDKNKKSIYEIPKTASKEPSAEAAPKYNRGGGYTKKSAPAATRVNEETQVSPQYSSMGVYVASKNNSKEAKETGSVGFVPAYLEEDTKIMDKATAVFILDKDCNINGISLKKNAILFGSVRSSGSYFDIVIHNVKNVDGNTYDFEHLVVFNEKYSRGITPEGNVSKALKESSDQTANSAGNDLGYAQNTSGQLAQQGLSNTVNALTRSRVSSVTLSQGYKVFIKLLK